MNYIIHVAMVDWFKDLLDTVRRVGFRIIFPGDDIFKKFATSDQIED